VLSEFRAHAVRSHCLMVRHLVRDGCAPHNACPALIKYARAAARELITL
jgi:hypothetical protein